MTHTDNLDNYKSYQPTKSCYLDGRYFNMVFRKYPGLIKEPLNIIFYQEGDGIKHTEYMKDTPIDNRYPGILRVIINTPTNRHSNLVIINYQEGKIYRFEPLGSKAPFFKEVNKIIERYLSMYMDFELFILEDQVYDEKNPLCENDDGGFCVAYVIKYAYDYLNGRLFDPSDILRFAANIQDYYGPLPEVGKDIEYGMFGGKGRNVIIGSLGGALVGGALTGRGGGALVGGLGGGLIGGLV